MHTVMKMFTDSQSVLLWFGNTVKVISTSVNGKNDQRRGMLTCHRLHIVCTKWRTSCHFLNTMEPDPPAHTQAPPRYRNMSV